jgi:hypothetical protein
MVSCKVTVFGERAEEFEDVFGTATVPVLGPLPELALVNGFEEPQPVYLLDLKALSHDQRDRLVAHIARKFGADEGAVADQLTALGLPILAADTIVCGDVPWWLD